LKNCIRKFVILSVASPRAESKDLARHFYCRLMGLGSFQTKIITAAKTAAARFFASAQNDCFGLCKGNGEIPQWTDYTPI
jgi:hypothetical protein